MMEIDLYEYLRNQESIISIVIDRVFACQLPETATFPCLTIQLAGSHRDETLLNPSGIVTHVYQIDSWAKDHSVTVELAEAVRNALQGYIGTMGDTEICYVSLINEESRTEAPTDASDNWIFRKFQQYKIKHQESLPQA